MAKIGWQMESNKYTINYHVSDHWTYSKKAYRPTQTIKAGRIYLKMHAAFSEPSKIDPGQFPLKFNLPDYIYKKIRTKDYQGLKIGPNS